MPTIRRPFASSAAHTPLFDLLRRAIRTAAHSMQPGAPPEDELLAMRGQFTASRRGFLKTVGAAAIGVGISGFLPGCRTIERGKQTVRLAIVGAGMAGLNAGWKLRNAGIEPMIFEASRRTGGRMFTARDIMAKGLTTELGGEFIDTTHTEMLALATEFGLPLHDTLRPSEASLVREMFFFDGKVYTEAEVIADFKPLAARIKADYDQLPDVIDFQRTDGATFDNQSIADYLTAIGATGRLRKLLEVAYVTEYGLDLDQQSAINFLFLIGEDLAPAGEAFSIFGPSDERYKVEGGNQRIVDELATRLAENIQTEHRLEAIRPHGGRGLTLTFQQGNGGAVDVHAEAAIITLPFSVLRSVDLSALDLPPVKRRAIAELGYGTNAKLMVGMKRRLWREQGYVGYCFTNEAAQMGWDNSQMQPGTEGGFTLFSGGAAGLTVGNGTPAAQAERLLPGIEKIYPGITAQQNGNIERFHWPSYPHALGSYSCYKPGQWTTIAGAEKLSIGNLYFAGEHCSYDFQGFMEGAATTGKSVAEEIIAVVRNKG